MRRAYTIVPPNPIVYYWAERGISVVCRNSRSDLAARTRVVYEAKRCREMRNTKLRQRRDHDDAGITAEHKVGAKD